MQAVTFTAKRERLLADGRRIEANLEDTALALYELESGVRVSHEISYTEVAGCDRFRWRSTLNSEQFGFAANADPQLCSRPY